LALVEPASLARSRRWDNASSKAGKSIRPAGSLGFESLRPRNGTLRAQFATRYLVLYVGWTLECIPSV
jgi:hypothetical protein